MNEITVRNSGWIKISTIKDGFDGTISVAEEFRDIPFKMKRAYYIYNLMNHEHVIRGKHAHKTLHQVLFCINGSCSVILDDGTNRQEVELNDPNVGVHIGPRLWHIMHSFRNNCILLVIASDIFREEDYIRDYDDFLRYIKSHPA